MKLGSIVGRRASAHDRALIDDAGGGTVVLDTNGKGIRDLGVRLAPRTVVYRILAAVFVLLPAMTADALARENTPRSVLTKFFEIYPSMRFESIPGEARIRTLSPVLSPGLRDLLRGALKAEKLWAKRHPDEPPMVEGDIWVSLFEGATGSRIGPCSIADDRAFCEVRLTYADPTDPAEWIDQFILLRTHDGWRLDDVKWGGDWEFMHKGTLRGLLSSVIAQAKTLPAE